MKAASEGNPDAAHAEHDDPSCASSNGAGLRRIAESPCQARLSPVSVQHAFGNASPAQKLQCLPAITLSFTHMYHNLVANRLWCTSFHRSLATRHLSHPSVDGWNVVAGAVELAHEWALRGTDLPADTSTPFEFSMATRFRLAMCISVSWKFQRAMYTSFPRRFYDEEPNLIAPHTRELAFLGYSFLYPDEQHAFGGWCDANGTNISQLYDQMIDLEFDLLKSVSVMSLLTHNAQVQAEERLQVMVDSGAVDGEAAMVLRSIVPFFRVASEDGNARRPTPGALLCAAILCLPEGRELAAKWFNDKDCGLARALLRAAIQVKGLAADTLSVGCYADPKWINHKYTCADALERALQVAGGLV